MQVPKQVPGEYNPVKLEIRNVLAAAALRLLEVLAKADQKVVQGG